MDCFIFLRCFFTFSLPVRNLPYSLRVADFLISAVNSFWHFLLSPLQRLQLWNVNRFFIFQYYWLQRYYCGEQVETKEVWVIALHVRICLRAALPSLDPQPACFSFTVQVFACILTPLYLSRYSLNSFHPLSLPFPSLLSSPNFLHILLALPPAQKHTFLIRLEMDATLSSASVFFFYFAGSSHLCCRSFSSHSVFLLRLFTKTTQTRTHTPPLHRNTLPPLQACLFPVAPELALFLWSWVHPRVQPESRTMQSSLSFGTPLVSAVNDFLFGLLRWLQMLCECTTYLEFNMPHACKCNNLYISLCTKKWDLFSSFQIAFMIVDHTI